MIKGASLPMYNLPEMQGANEAFLHALHERIIEHGLETCDAETDECPWLRSDGISPETLFTQICGYPLFKHFRGQGAVLATPCYAIEGCDGPYHRAFFMVRADESAQRLEDFRDRIFGCNSLDSNSGMNLPRLSLAQTADRQLLFRAVVLTGSHVQSLAQLVDGTIDLCSVDCVTWGFVARFEPELAKRVRVLAPTASSPSLPFVTSAARPPDEIHALRAALDDFFADPGTAEIRAAMALTKIEHLPDSAYEILARYEQEAAERGYPEIR
jgi:ABC-type phosphate/phosphonate transport system substrate-binding protein